MNRARRKRISDLLMLSGQWRPGTVQIGNDGMVWAAPAEGRKSRKVVGPVESIVDENGNAQGEWALLEKNTARSKGHSDFEQTVLKRLKAIEDKLHTIFSRI